MSTITPPPPPTISAPLPAAPPVLTISNPSIDLTQLMIGSKLDAVIMGGSEKGAVQIQIPSGLVTAQTNIALPANATVTLQVLSLGSLAKLLITSINGQPTPALSMSNSSLFASPQMPGGAAGSSTGATGNNSPSVNISIGTGLVATLLRPGTFTSGLSANPVGGAATAGAGQASLSVALQAQSAKTSMSNTSATAQTTATSGKAGSLASAAGARTTAQGASHGGQPQNVSGHTTSSALSTPQSGAPQGTQFSVQITGLSLPSASGSAPTLPATGLGPPQIGQTITGIVSSQVTTSGQPVINTPRGPIALSTSAPLVPNTELKLMVTGNTDQSTLAQQARDTARINRLAFQHGQRWETLAEALKGVNDANPTIAQHLQNVLIPRPDTLLAAQILFFMTALRGGDLRGWIGDGPLRVLDRSKPDTLNRLKSDFESMARSTREPDGPEGRSVTVPFLNNNEIDKIRFWTHQYGSEGQENENDAKNAGTRFVLDFELSVLGRVQLDGNVNIKEKKFDLFIRTDDPMPLPVQNSIREIFLNSNQITGSSGGLSFQATPANFFTIPVAKEDNDGLGITI